MNILIYVNPKSGRGKAQFICDQLLVSLNERGHKVTCLSALENTHDSNSLLLNSELPQADRLIVIGGDGTVHHLLPHLARSSTPFYHVGTGTANLIAREFNMSTSPKQILVDIERDHQPLMLDLPTCNEVPFLLMVSIGIDGSIIHRLEQSKRTKRGYRAYLSPILGEIVSPRFARIRYRLDSDDNWISLHGGLIISNLRSYGGGFNPSPNADPTDQSLDLYTAQTGSIFQAIAQFGCLRIGRDLKSMSRSQCKELIVQGLPGSSGSFVQVDGEQPRSIPSLHNGVLNDSAELRVSISEGKIPVHAFVS